MELQPMNTLQVPIKKEQYIEKDGVIYSLKRIGTQAEIISSQEKRNSSISKFINNGIDQITDIEEALDIKFENKPSKK